MKQFFNSLLRRPGSKQPIIIVSGLPRSGTSLMMAMLEAGGVPVITDHARAADVDNPRGYYEFEQVKKLDRGDTAWVASAPGKAVKVISALLEYLPDTVTYKVIFMRRDFNEILASQKKMLANRGEAQDEVSDAEMLEVFTNHVNHTLRWLRMQPHFSVFQVDYNELLDEPAPYIQQLAQFLYDTHADKLDTEKMLGVVDRNLYRSRA
jgi:hypothetical protein